MVHTGIRCHALVMLLSSRALMTCTLTPWVSLVEVRLAGKMLSVEPTIDPTTKLQETKLGAYCEVGARTILLEVAMGDYSYVVNDAQITYTKIGKFCSIAAMTRINPRGLYRRKQVLLPPDFLHSGKDRRLKLRRACQKH
jgi:hypothetical protein